MLNAKSATGAECKTKRLQRVKVKHEIEQYIKRVQHEDKVQHEKVATQKSATCNWCNMKKYNFNSEIRKKCTRIVHYKEKLITACLLTDCYTLVSFFKSMSKHKKTTHLFSIVDYHIHDVN